MKNMQFSTNISLYLENDTREGHSYYITRQQELVCDLQSGAI